MTDTEKTIEARLRALPVPYNERHEEHRYWNGDTCGPDCLDYAAHETALQAADRIHSQAERIAELDREVTHWFQIDQHDTARLAALEKVVEAASLVYRVWWTLSDGEVVGVPMRAMDALHDALAALDATAGTTRVCPLETHGPFCEPSDIHPATAGTTEEGK